LEHDLQPPPLTQKRPTLQDRTSNLESVFATQSVLLVVDGTAFGTAHYRYEPNTVLEVLNELVNCSLTILIVSHFSDQRNQVFYDEQIVWDQTEIISSNVLQNTIQRLCTSTLHKQIIDVLKTQTCTLFELCDKLDTITQTTVFEPEIEYALWHLRPLLKTTIKANDDQTQSDRVWTVFSSEVAP
jgi:50S ribosomal subunit-associated GTPase HflX